MFAKQHLKVPICAAFGVFENNVHDATRSCDHWASTKLTRGQMQMLSICVQRSKSKQQKYINAHLEIQQIKIRPWKLNGLGWQIRFMNIYNSSWPKKCCSRLFLCPTIMFVLWCSKVGQTAGSETQQTSSVRWPLWQSVEIKTTFVVVVWILRQLNRNLISNQTLLNDDVTNHVSREFLVKERLRKKLSN